jgi:hypothetical protein
MLAGCWCLHLCLHLCLLKSYTLLLYIHDPFNSLMFVKHLFVLFSAKSEPAPSEGACCIQGGLAGWLAGWLASWLALLGSPGLSWILLGSSGVSWALLGSSGVSWAPGHKYINMCVIYSLEVHCLHVCRCLVVLALQEIVCHSVSRPCSMGSAKGKQNKGPQRGQGPHKGKGSAKGKQMSTGSSESPRLVVVVVRSSSSSSSCGRGRLRAVARSSSIIWAMFFLMQDVEKDKN